MVIRGTIGKSALLIFAESSADVTRKIFVGELILTGNFEAFRGTASIRHSRYVVKIWMEGCLINGFVAGVDSSVYQRKLDATCMMLDGIWLDENLGRATDETVAVFFLSKFGNDIDRVQVISDESEVLISQNDLGYEGSDGYLQRQIGIHHLLLGELELADQVFSELLSRYPDDVQTLNLRGRVRRYLGNLDLAEIDFRLAIDLDGGWFELWRNLANTLLIKEKYEEMTSAFEEALRLAPSNSVVINNYGYALYSFGKYEEALKYCQQAIKIDSDYYEAYLDTAEICKGLGKTEEYEYWIRESEKHYTKYPMYSIGISKR